MLLLVPFVISGILLVVFLSLLPFWLYIAWKIKWTRNVVFSGLVPVFIAMAISRYVDLHSKGCTNVSIFLGTVKPRLSGCLSYGNCKWQCSVTLRLSPFSTILYNFKDIEGSESLRLQLYICTYISQTSWPSNLSAGDGSPTSVFTQITCFPYLGILSS